MRLLSPGCAFFLLVACGGGVTNATGTSGAGSVGATSSSTTGAATTTGAQLGQTTGSRATATSASSAASASGSGGHGTSGTSTGATSSGTASGGSTGGSSTGATPSGVPSRGFGLLAYPGDGRGTAFFENQYDNFVAQSGFTPKFVLVYTGTWQSMADIAAGQVSQATAWAAETTRTGPATGTIPVIGLTLQTKANDMTLANIPTGVADSFFEQLITAWSSLGYKELWFRPSYEQNLGATCPSNEGAGTGPNWPGGAPAEPAYAPLAVAAHDYFYTKIHAYAAAHGVTVQVIWNPTVDIWCDVQPTEYYPGANFVDIEAVDLYTDNFWGTASTMTVPGYNGQPPFSFGFVPSGGSGTNKTLTNWDTDYDNVSWFLDFTDGVATPYVPKSGGGWSLYNAMQHALLNKKPFTFCEYGVLGSSSGGNGSLTDSSGMGEDLNLGAWTRKRIAWYQAQGGDFLSLNIWDSVGNPTLQSFKTVWPAGGTQ